MLTSTDLEKFVKDHNIAAEIVFLEKETPTVEAAAAAMNVLPGQIVKSVLFLLKQADGSRNPLLVVTSGTSRIAWKQLADYLGISRRRVKMAKADEVLNITGFPVGTVPPFGHKEKLDTLLEANVLKQNEILGGGGAINALMRLTVDELQRVLQAPLVNIAEE